MKDLYEISQIVKQQNDFKATITINPAHEIFAGHFPGQPVVPGVFLVEILASSVTEIIGKQLIIKEASNLKFLQVIDPEVHGSVLLDGSIVIVSDGNYRVDATIRLGEVLFTKMKGVLLSSDF